MPLLTLIWCGLLALLASPCLARDVSRINPPFPRIANCYGAGLGYRSWEQGREYWSKLDLFIGGCYDLHYDWEHPRWAKVLATVEENVRKLREVNPNALVLPYVDVIEGPLNPNLPEPWWLLNDKGEKVSTWPGFFRVKTGLPEVLQLNLDKVRDEVAGRDCFDGVFYDCWKPEKWLVPRTAALRDGQAIVMLNDWNLPAAGFETLNGALAEDEINRIIDGRVDFEEFLARYLRWCRDSRKPCVTTLVCNPHGLDNDPWRIHAMKRTAEQRKQDEERERTHDEKTMRFGLAVTLMGDGYFAFDGPTTGRGNWWWYKEYDAPLGYPKGAARRNPDGTWQREFEGGVVIVNGTLYDAVVAPGGRRRDFSTGRVAARFTLPTFDGRIFAPTTEPLTTTPDVEPRLAAAPPKSLRVARLDGGMAGVQTPGGLELRFEATGALRHLLWRGKRLMTGGFPVVAAPPFRSFGVENAAGGPGEPAIRQGAGGPEAALAYRGTFVHGDRRADYVEKVTVSEDGRLTLHFDFTAVTDLNIRLWRHYFVFPVARYAGATAEAEGKSVTLPAELKEAELLPAGRRISIDAPDATIVIESSVPLGLVDHRKWGTPEYLLAGYPVNGEVKKGTAWSVGITVTVTARR